MLLYGGVFIIEVLSYTIVGKTRGAPDGVLIQIPPVADWVFLVNKIWGWRWAVISSA